MREILFRAKRADNGEWVESDCIMQFKPHPMTEQDEIHLWEHGEGWVVCRLDTVGQFTGLTDKNGKRIFEGDILRVDDTENALVRYGRRAQFEVEFDSSVCDFALLYQYNYDGEVIGNIHDNPELL